MNKISIFVVFIFTGFPHVILIIFMFTEIIFRNPATVEPPAPPVIFPCINESHSWAGQPVFGSRRAQVFSINRPIGDRARKTADASATSDCSFTLRMVLSSMTD